MPTRRILSLWFPRLGADRLMRQDRSGMLYDAPFAVVRDTGQMQVLVWLSEAAAAQGLQPGQPLRDARALCPGLVTRLQNPQAEGDFLNGLQRWAGRFSPWVGIEPPAGLTLDITGCAHLFGGESALVTRIDAEARDLGLTLEAGLADTVGAAWALARYAGRAPDALRSGDAVDQEARATRSRAAKRRHWERGGAAPGIALPPVPVLRIAPPGRTHSALAALPVTALRIDADTAQQLTRLGITRIGDLAGMPRAALARRFGQAVVRRLDQALGADPEPVSPARPAMRFAVRLTLPDPIGLEADIMAGIDKLLPELAKRLRDKGRGARRVRLTAYRSDQGAEGFDFGLARPTDDPERMRPLILMKLGDIDAGFGIDALRLEATVTEPLTARQHAGQFEATQTARAVQARGGRGLEDLMGRIGTRIGLEAITRLHPADSHIPEKTALVLAAAWSDPAPSPWPHTPRPRPMLMWRPEPITSDSPGAAVPLAFHWRRRAMRPVTARGPERISPEWWLDDPAWRNGVRDYWDITCESGERLWLFYAHGGALSAGWFCHGSFV